MQTQTIGIPSSTTEGCYRFMVPKDAVDAIVKSIRVSSIYEQWIYSVMLAAKHTYKQLLPPDREPFLAALRDQFGDDADTLTNNAQMGNYRASANEAVQDARDCMYDGA